MRTLEEIKLNDCCLIIGGANHVEEDLRHLKEIVHPYDLDEVFWVIAVNNQIYNWEGRTDVFCTLHGEKAERWIGRRPKSLNWDFVTYNMRTYPKKTSVGEDLVFKELKHKWRGSSGLYAVQVALLELGIRKVVLAGVPMTTDPNFFRGDKEWKQGKRYQEGWLDVVRKSDQLGFDLTNHVRSMSGWTREQFGLPDQSFIFEEVPPRVPLEQKATETVSGDWSTRGRKKRKKKEKEAKIRRKRSERIKRKSRR